jgi:alpha,alpha-trehalase
MDTAAHSALQEAPPALRLGELFAVVAMTDVFRAKDWADAEAKATVKEIVAAYRRAAPNSREDIYAFVKRWFDLPAEVTSTLQATDLLAHIEATWPTLIRPASPAHAPSSLLPLPHESIAPGGRFRECYYWDCYFTLLGLRHRPATLRAAIDNFCAQIDRYGFVPTANRTYYLSRSQPPLLFKMVELLADVEGTQVISRYLPALVKEHAFWMDGADRLIAPGAHRRIVRLEDGALLNRYWDDRAAPRDESYRVDVEAAKSANRPADAIYRDIRAACESGWDFSSRWLADPNNFGSIITTSILPVDLNAILFGLESFIASAYASDGQASEACRYRALAASRREAMNKRLWNTALGAFDDYNWETGVLRGAISAAAAAPLYFGVANDDQAKATAKLIGSKLLAPGGLLATSRSTGLQWDAPNGWAPLQWIAVEGLTRHGFIELADKIRSRWVSAVTRVFNETGRLVEKYDVVSSTPGGGGEYPVQDGFGWTNGVVKAFSV